MLARKRFCSRQLSLVEGAAVPKLAVQGDLLECSVPNMLLIACTCIVLRLCVCVESFQRQRLRETFADARSALEQKLRVTRGLIDDLLFSRVISEEQSHTIMVHMLLRSTVIYWRCAA